MVNVVFYLPVFSVLCGTQHHLEEVLEGFLAAVTLCRYFHPFYITTQFSIHLAPKSGGLLSNVVSMTDTGMLLFRKLVRAGTFSRRFPAFTTVRLPSRCFIFFVSWRTASVRFHVTPILCAGFHFFFIFLLCFY